MKNSDILKCLKANKKISSYEFVVTNKDSRELYYVLDHLEINRAVKTTNKGVAVYVNTKDKTGSSRFTIIEADDVRSLNKKINAAALKAKAGLNKFYPIASKTKNINTKEKKYDLNDIACKIGKAVYKADTFKNGWLNSTEIFVSNVKKEFINSNGVHHITSSLSIKIEVIPTWKGEKEEIELYKFYESNVVNYDEITNEVKQLLENAKQRSIAKTLSQVKLPKNLKVLVSNDMLTSIVDCIKNDCSYRCNFQKANHFKVNDLICDPSLNLTLVPSVKGCSKSKLFDEDGIVLSKKQLIKDGKLLDNFGSIRFGTYLNKKKITGDVPVSVVEGKRYNYKKEKHLIIENFSSPQLDESIGYWGGEVRLARYFDGKKYIPLTGFSISGNIYDDLKSVKLSKENINLSDYSGPKYWIFNNISIH